ncbi:MAG TPA: N-acetylglucosamine-6-phosphate deacetylase [Methylocella sp.]|nr:N-acetylglucosamine-6-phosphate deacetylase [Methylocella sp.]
MSGCDRHAIAADFIFDGAVTHRDSVVVIEGSRIGALMPRSQMSAFGETFKLPPGAWLAPGFIDVQVNGGGDVLFNADPTPEGISKIVRAHRKFGTTALLPTLITDTDEVMAASLSAIERMIAREPGVLGIHFEGPFLSPEKSGVHRPDLCRRPEPRHRQMLTRLRDGVSLVTLAPEETPQGFIAELVTAGVKVSLGHSMATYLQTRAAMAEGLTGFTHLFNAMRPLSSREPGPIAAALESPNAFYGMIVDGEHVAPAMLRLAIRGGTGHPMLVTDSMPPVGGCKQEFFLQGQKITVRDGRCSTAQGALAGSAINMAAAVRNCIQLLGLPLEQALAIASSEPANFLGLGHFLGRLAPGYRADIVAFRPGDLEVLATWVAGESSHDR